jgi:hypothetical protein
VEHVFEHDLSERDDYEYQLRRKLWDAANLHDNANPVSHVHAHRNGDVHRNADEYGNTDTHGNADVHRNADQHGNSDRHGNANVHRNADQHSNLHCDVDEHRNAE